MEALEQELKDMKKLLEEKNAIIEALKEKLKIYEEIDKVAPASLPLDLIEDNQKVSVIIFFQKNIIPQKVETCILFKPNTSLV